MQWVSTCLKGSPAASFLLAAACSAPVASVPSAVPLSEATVEAGQLFPSYLATTGKGCEYPAISNPPILSEFSSNWYSAQLLAANERPLTELAAADPQQLYVRFIWLRSFDQPIIVRIHGQPAGGGMIDAIRLSGAGGYEPGEIAEHLNRQLSVTEFREFEALLDGSWLVTEPAANCDQGVDGAEWVLEVLADGHYSFFERWSPDEGPVRDVAFKILTLTGFDLDPVY